MVHVPAKFAFSINSTKTKRDRRIDRQTDGGGGRLLYLQSQAGGRTDWGIAISPDYGPMARRKIINTIYTLNTLISANNTFIYQTINTVMHYYVLYFFNHFSTKLYVCVCAFIEYTVHTCGRIIMSTISRKILIHA